MNDGGFQALGSCKLSLDATMRSKWKPCGARCVPQGFHFERIVASLALDDSCSL